MITLTHPTYGNVETACAHIIKELDTKGIRPTRIVALSRGGLTLGVILSHNLNIPMTPVQYSSKKGVGDNRNHCNDLPAIANEVLLIVDDIADSGHSLKEVVDFYTSTDSNSVFSATMYLRQGSVIVPSSHWHSLQQEGPFIHFPWERRLT